MKKQKQRLKKYLLATIIFCAVFVVATAIKAAVITGWSWGGSEDGNITGTNSIVDGNETGAGWISMSGSNYGVNLPSGNGAVTGYAWSSNLGYIDFDSKNNCTAGTPSATQYKAQSCTNPDGNTNGVSRNGSDLVGWARIVDIAKESVNNNSGGWQGWIKMSGSGYGVKVSGTSLYGYAWNGEEAGSGSNIANGLGWIDFGKLPTVTMTADGAETELFRIDLGISILPKSVTIGWTSTGATSCDATGLWASSNIGLSGSQVISISGGTNGNVTITCGGVSDMVTIMTVCYPKTCASQACSNDLSDIRTGVSNTNVCTSASTCSTDPDCKTRSIGDWKEVAP